MKNRKFFLGCLLGVSFVLLSFLIVVKRTTMFDNFLYECLIHKELITNVMKGITTMGEHITIALLAVCLVIFLRDKRCALFIGGSTLVVALLNSGLKLLFKRVRPSDIAIITETSYSFPSGHSIASIFFYGFILCLIYKSDFSKKIKLSTMSLLGVLIFMIGLSRIYLGVHYASDVLGGFILGGLFLIIFTSLYNSLLNKK